MDIQSLYSQITDEFADKILNWAIKKTGNRADGEDLAQEVFLQIYLAVSKQERIEKLEHFIWKVARYVWYKYMRELKTHVTSELSETLPDITDFAHDYDENDALQFELARMRRSLANLSRLQREMMILHYLDDLSVRDVAVQLCTSESAVTWHLFSARKKVREDIAMKEDKSILYHPGKLSVGYSGEATDYPDTQKVNDSLIRQNLCLLCHSEGKTLNDLVESTGIPKPFLEYDLEWLVQHEFLALHGKRYYTTFLILNQKYFDNRIEIYRASKTNYIDVIISELWQQEERIRKIKFYGADFPAEKLFWSIIMMFTSYCSRNSELMLKLKNRNNSEIRPDGGKYYVMASDRSDGVKSGFSHLEPTGWNDFYGICSDSCQTGGKYDTYYWLGVFNYAERQYHPEIITANIETRAITHRVYCKTIESDFSADALTPEEKEKLAKAVESGLIAKEGCCYKPNFVIFTLEQLAMMQKDVFAPLLKKISPEMAKLSERFSKLHKDDFPKASECGVEHHVYMDLWDFGIFTLMFAAEDGKLSLPSTPEQGVPLTMVLVK